MVTLAACNLDYHEYANYGKDYIDESYEKCNWYDYQCLFHIRL